MAITESGVLLPTWLADLSDNFNLNLDAETHRVALFDNTITPNLDTETAYGTGAFSTGEVVGVGYVAGGELLTSTTLSISGGRIYWNADDVEWLNSTITNARGSLTYAAAAGDEAIVLHDFGADFSTVNGTFKIQWHNDGLLYVAR